jgi:hypothetical protein
VVDGATANGLTKLFMDSLDTKGGLDTDAIASKLLCFGVDGVSTFQKKQTGVIVQIKKNYEPFVTCVHCHALKINLAVKTFSQLLVVLAVEELMKISYVYFSHCLKKYNEYKTFGSTIDTKGLKLIRKVTTRWFSHEAFHEGVPYYLGKNGGGCKNK